MPSTRRFSTRAAQAAAEPPADLNGDGDMVEADGSDLQPLEPLGTPDDASEEEEDDEEVLEPDAAADVDRGGLRDDNVRTLARHAPLVQASSSRSQSGTDSMTWISWFCSLPSHEYFAEVAEDFIEDDFNLTGLNALVPFYKEALEMVLDVEPEEESLKVPDVSIVESSAELLYGLIHQRFIITRQGLQQMLGKYGDAHFGFCPRVYCSATKVLPCGRSDLPGVDTVKLFCPNCLDTYTPPSSRFNGVDGAFFGTTFPHLLLQTFKDVLPPTVVAGGAGAPVGSRGASPGTPDGAIGGQLGSPVAASPQQQPMVLTAGGVPSAARIYVPRIYGFKVSERARSGPRMQWLRMLSRPANEDAEFDRVDLHGRWREGQAPSTATSNAAAASAAAPSSSRSRSGIVDSPRPSPPSRTADLPAPSKRRALPLPPGASAGIPPRTSSSSTQAPAMAVAEG